MEAQSDQPLLRTVTTVRFVEVRRMTGAPIKKQKGHKSITSKTAKIVYRSPHLKYNALKFVSNYYTYDQK